MGLYMQFLAWAILAISIGGWTLALLAERRKIANSRLLGIAVLLQIRFNPLFNNRRKFIFEFGKDQQERLSCYISADNIFTYSFTDAKSEPHLIQIGLGNDGDIGIPICEFITLGLQLGISGGTTKMSVLINGKEHKIVFPFKIDIGCLDLREGKFGSDINGENGGSFDIDQIFVFRSTIPDASWKELHEVLFSDGHPRAYNEFNGEKWLTINPTTGDLEQPDSKCRPVNRKIR